MDHISKIIQGNGKPTSPGMGVSQSRFLSPCRRVGLKRPANKFVVKFKEIINCVETKCLEVENPPVINTEVEEDSKIETESVNANNKDIASRSKHEITSDTGACETSETQANISRMKNKSPIDECTKQRKIKSKTRNSEVPVKPCTKRLCPSPDLMDRQSVLLLENCVDVSVNKPNFQNKCDNLLENLKDELASNTARDINISETLPKMSTPLFDRNKSCDTNLSSSKLSETNSRVPDASAKSNSSLCESITNITCNEDSTESCVSGSIKHSKPRNSKRFKTPLKKGFVVKKIKMEIDEGSSDLEKRIAEKEKKIAEMKSIIANSSKHNVNHLDVLIGKWRTGCQEALSQLLSEIQSRSGEPYDMNKLLRELNIPHELVKYSEAEQDFYS